MNKKIKLMAILLAMTIMFVSCDQTQTDEDVKTLRNYESELVDLDVSVSDYTTFYDDGEFIIETTSETIDHDINEEIYLNLKNDGEKFAENIEIGLTGDVIADENIQIEEDSKEIYETLRIGEDNQIEEYFTIEQINSKFSRDIDLSYYYLYNYETDLNTITCLENPYIKTELQRCEPRGELEYEFSSGPLGIKSMVQEAIKKDNYFTFTYKITLDNSLGGKFLTLNADENEFETNINTGRFENKVEMTLETPISSATLICEDGRRTTVTSTSDSNKYIISFDKDTLEPVIECSLEIPSSKVNGKNYLTANFKYTFYNEDTLKIRNEYEDLTMI